MAQELFMCDEERDRIKRERLIKRGVQLWTNSAEDYRTLPIKYSFYLNERRKAKIPLRKVSTAYYKEELYPVIPLFRMLSLDEVTDWLENVELSVLEAEIDRIEYELESNYLYRSMKAWVAETIYLLTHDKPGPFSLAMGVTPSGVTKPRFTTTRAATAD